MVVLKTAGARQIQRREENTYVWNLVENLSITAGLPMPKIYLIDDPSPNAFATGRNPEHASIALTTGIVQLLENEELEGVISHELSHIKNLDIRWMMLVAVIVGSLSLLTQYFLRGSFFGRRRGTNQENGTYMIVGFILLILSPVIGEMIKLAISRKREYLADASGALLTRYPEGLARALEKISHANQPLARAPQATAHLWIANPLGQNGATRRFAHFFSTHPPIADRINELRKMANAK
jgi:heat shock protein HtpX